MGKKEPKEIEIEIDLGLVAYAIVLGLMVWLIVKGI